MRQYEETIKYVAKSWDELTPSEREEVMEKAMNDDGLREQYSYVESEYYKELRNDIIRRNSKLIDDIDVYWQYSSQGPYLKGDWKVELSSFPTYTCDMSKFGFGMVDVTVTDVYPDRHGILPKSGYFEFEFDWENDNVEFEDIENAVDKCKDTYNVMVEYANFINHALQEYWDNINSYCSGYQYFKDYVKNEFEELDVDFIFKVMSNGSEVYVRPEYN